jgi:uroporphyrinogen decarboxylase
MNHRERVLAALRHKEPDRLPIDLGATAVTGVMAVTYKKLRERLGLEPHVLYVADTYQQRSRYRHLWRWRLL